MITFIALLSTAMQTEPSPRVQPFPVGAVKVTGGPALRAEQVCSDYLLELDPERLLHGFRTNAGMEPKAPIYGGWENSGLAGHTLGHFLTACAQRYARTGDERYKAKVDAVVAGLVECQKARPDGCISAIPGGDKVWEELRRRDIRSRGFDLNGLWSPWYTHHKVFAGLLDAHELCGSEDALSVAERFANWAIDLTKDFADADWQKMLGCEYGGMNESLAELHARTGKEAYLALARKFYDRNVLDPLAEGRDELQGKHSNTQIPKLVGLARLYDLKGEERDRKAAEFFWRAIAQDHSYVIGGNSNHEYLGPPRKLNDRLSTNTAETCNTYNMLRLTKQVFSWEPRAEVADFYERAYLNHILASQNPRNGMMTYFMPLVSGAARRYSNKFDNFTCCHGSGLETHTKHGDGAYYHRCGSQLWVALFLPSELEWKQAGIKLRQETDFPTSGKVRLSVAEGEASFEMLVRHPAWAPRVEFKIDGRTVSVSEKPGSFASIRRTWKKGEALEFDLPLSLRTEAMPDNPDRLAVLYGPVVLAADLGPDRGERPRVPVLVTGGNTVDQWMERPDPAALEWRSKGALRPGDLTFRPFHELAERRYAVYFDRFDEAGWQKLEAQFRAEEAARRDLDARTVDLVRVGEMQPERDHNLMSEKCDVRESDGRSFRTPLADGWFELDMKVDPERELDLVTTYWGSDRNRAEFEILVDGRSLVVETLPSHRPNVFFDETRPLPIDWTKGKKTIKVRYRALPGKAAAAVAGIRVVRRAQ